MRNTSDRSGSWSRLSILPSCRTSRLTSMRTTSRPRTDKRPALRRPRARRPLQRRLLLSRTPRRSSARRVRSAGSLTAAKGFQHQPRTCWPSLTTPLQSIRLHPILSAPWSSPVQRTDWRSPACTATTRLNTSGTGSLPRSATAMRGSSRGRWQPVASKQAV